jgi:hypothetical protein
MLGHGKKKDINPHHENIIEGAHRGYTVCSVEMAKSFYSYYCYFSVSDKLDNLNLLPASKSSELWFFFKLCLNKFRLYLISTKSSVH